MNKKVVLIVLGVIVAVVGFLYFTKPAEQTGGTLSEHTTGAGSTGVVLVEYGDFQCPACGSYYPVLQQVKAKYGDQITLQFRNFPLESIHVNARAASRAAEAASLQGKFWEMHDKLFESQLQWSETKDPVGTFKAFAEQLQLDAAKFEQDYRSSEVNSVINADLAEGRRLGASSTPTFVLNGEKIENPGASLEAFSAVLDKAIADKTGQQPEATKPEENENSSPEAADQTVETE